MGQVGSTNFNIMKFRNDAVVYKILCINTIFLKFVSIKLAKKNSISIVLLFITNLFQKVEMGQVENYGAR